MQSARSSHVGVAGQDLIKLVRILSGNVAERGARNGLTQFGIDHATSVPRSIKVRRMKRQHWLLIAAVAGGALIWVMISTASGKREAWDSALYFSIGMPAVCLLAALLGFLEPHRTWRWGAAPLAGQFLAMLLMVGPGSLLPLGIILFGVLAIPSIIAARLAAYLRSYVTRSGSGGGRS